MTQSDTTTKLPIRLLLQVREGVPNEIGHFDVECRSSSPLAADDPDRLEGAKLVHEVSVADIIAGLRSAADRLEEEEEESAANLAAGSDLLTKHDPHLGEIGSAI